MYKTFKAAKAFFEHWNPPQTISLLDVTVGRS